MKQTSIRIMYHITLLRDTAGILVKYKPDMQKTLTKLEGTLVVF